MKTQVPSLLTPSSKVVRLPIPELQSWFTECSEQLVKPELPVELKDVLESMAAALEVPESNFPVPRFVEAMTFTDKSVVQEDTDLCVACMEMMSRRLRHPPPPWNDIINYKADGGSRPVADRVLYESIREGILGSVEDPDLGEKIAENYKKDLMKGAFGMGGYEQMTDSNSNFGQQLVGFFGGTFGLLTGTLGAIVVTPIATAVDKDHEKLDTWVAKCESCKTGTNYDSRKICLELRLGCLATKQFESLMMAKINMASPSATGVSGGSASPLVTTPVTDTSDAKRTLDTLEALARTE